MSIEYLHGAYAGRKKSEESILNCKSVPVYIGTAPVNRVSGYNSDNKPVLIRSAADAALKLGFKDTDKFKEFTLSAAIYCHFLNNIQPIGPIICINVLNSQDNSIEENNKELTFVNSICYIEDNVIIDTLEIEGKVKGEDYSASFDNIGRLKITLLGNNIASPLTLNVSYKKLKTNLEIEINDIIGDYNAETGRSSGIKAVSDIYEDLNLVPSNILVPYHEEKEVYNEILKLTKNLNNKFETIGFFDLGEGEEVNTLNKVLSFKENDNTFIDNDIKVFWPYQIVNGQDVPLSIVANVAKMQVDNKHNGLPCESCSNKSVFSKGNILNGNIIKINQQKGNELNKLGITTAIYNEGEFVCWGGHMSNYKDGLTDSPEEIFDVNIMVQKHLENMFIRKYSKYIDKAVNRSDIDTVKLMAQMDLDELVGAQEMLFGKVEFIESENSLNDLIKGDFKLKTLVTNKPLMKSITNYFQYTSEGLNSLLVNEEEEQN